MQDTSRQALINLTLAAIRKERVSLQIEKRTQQEIEEALIATGLLYTREYWITPGNIPDFFHLQAGILIEVKIKGRARAIYDQCVRYSKYDQVKAIILATNIPMGFPSEINGKPCYLINLAKGWL